MDSYQPLDPKDLEKGYYFLTHRDLFKKVAIIAAIVLIGALYLSAAFNFMKLLRGNSYQALAIDINKTMDWVSYHQVRAPIPVVASDTRFIALGDRRYDLVAFVENPNSDWAVTEFQYRFVVNNEALEIKTAFLNPGESHFIIESGYVSNVGISNLVIETGQYKWRRYEQDTATVAWDVLDAKYQPVSRKTVDNENIIIPPRMTWSAKNMSLYNFWLVGWQVILYKGDQLVAVRELQTKDFDALETKELEVVWLNDLPRITKTEVYPILNWLDRDNYKEIDVDRGASNRLQL